MEMIYLRVELETTLLHHRRKWIRFIYILTSDGNDIIAKFNLNFNNIISFEPVKDFEIDKDKIDLKSFNYDGFEEVFLRLKPIPDGHTEFSDRDCTVLIYDIRVEEFTSDNFILI